MQALGGVLLVLCGLPAAIFGIYGGLTNFVAERAPEDLVLGLAVTVSGIVTIGAGIALL